MVSLVSSTALLFLCLFRSFTTAATDTIAITSVTRLLHVASFHASNVTKVSAVHIWNAVILKCLAASSRSRRLFSISYIPHMLVVLQMDCWKLFSWHLECSPTSSSSELLWSSSMSTTSPSTVISFRDFPLYIQQHFRCGMPSRFC